MKKLFNILFILMTMLLLAACNIEEPKEEKKDIEDETPYISEVYETYDDKDRISYSLDKGSTWQITSDELEEFDIWNVEFNEEVRGMIFFFATSHEEFEEKVEEFKIPCFYSYGYIDEDGWKTLLETYDEEYFNDNVLLFYYKYEPNISKNYVHNVIIKDDSLILNVNRFEGMATALSAWIELITIKKVDIKDVKDYSVSVRTISPLVKSITVYPKESYMRNIYINGLDMEDFEGLRNLESIDVWNWGIKIDIKFNQTITDERLKSIIEILKASKNIRSVGYTSNTWIRVSIDNKYYDKYLDNTLTLEDVLEGSIEGSDAFSLEVLKFTPIVIITLKMENHGKMYAEAMKKELKELNLPFIDYDESLKDGSYYN